MEHPEVSEAAVVGYPHDVKGEAVFAFIVLKEDFHSTQEEIMADLRKLVRSKIAGYAIPEVFLVRRTLVYTLRNLFAEYSVIIASLTWCNRGESCADVMNSINNPGL